MATRTGNAERREEALSRERIVGAAVQMLDGAGESGLTFRALSAHLKTGPGAIYWHVANKSELLAAATDAVLAAVIAADDTDDTPADAIRAVALGVFDAVTAHPWIGAQLSGVASQSATLQIFERIGQQVQALGVPDAALFDAASALLNYILGVAGQNAANARTQGSHTNRTDVLTAESAVWESLDPQRYPFTRKVASRMRDHDDRAQFLAGIDLVLTGIAGLHRPPSDGSPVDDLPANSPTADSPTADSPSVGGLSAVGGVPRQSASRRLSGPR